MPRKKAKYLRIAQFGEYPKTRKEREKLYRFLEGTGFMRQLLTAREIIIREE